MTMNLKNKQLENAFDKFLSSSNLKDIISAFNQLCDMVDLNPAVNTSSFYKLLRDKYKSYWKANSLFSKLDKKVSQKEYRNQTACSNIKTLVIGAGPCGLRCAIEFALLGARVVVLDKRHSFSRNNVLHLWPFVINDLNFLGAKKFYGLFCSGSINHISIRRLQCILLKIALLFGVQVFIGVTFKELVSPVIRDINKIIVTAEGDNDNSMLADKVYGWRVKIEPDDCILSNYEFDVIVGADGKSNILGFKHKELRCRLAIAITANFINNNTPEEAQVEEISGVAFIFNQQFFKDLHKKTGIDLENIVYYKDETHYYVMTAKKHSLLSKGVLNRDYDDPETLLRSDNINQEALQNYAREAANVATNNKLTNLQFSLNHRGEPDVALFDFTHMFAAENASMIVERNEFPLIKMLVGDSLLEPFWPTGSGCGLGFLSALDSAWLVRRIGMINSALYNGKISESQQNILMLEAIAERESVYQRLSQTNASNMPPNLDSYTIDPRTRYTQCKLNCIEIDQILHLYDTDDKMKILPIATTRQNQVNPLPFIGLNNSFNSLSRDISISQEDSAEGSIMKSEQILRWFQIRLDRYSDSKMFKICDLNKSWCSGVPFLCLIHLYRPDLVDLASVNDENKYQNLKKGLVLFEKEFKIRSTLNIDDGWEKQDPVKMLFYLEKIYAVFQSLKPIRSDENIQPRSREIRQLKRRPASNTNVENSFVNKFHSNSYIGKPFRKSIVSRLKCSDIEKGIIRKRREEIIKQYEPKEHIPVKRTHSKGIITALSEKLSVHKPLNKSHKEVKTKVMEKNGTRKPKHFESQIYSNQTCHFCDMQIIHAEQGKFQGFLFHKQCFRCQCCDKILITGEFRLLEDLNKSGGGHFYCTSHYQQMKLSLLKNKFQGTNGANLKNDQNDGLCKLKKPRYLLKDFGELISAKNLSLLPTNQNFNNFSPISNEELQRKLSNVLSSLRRVNDESDEDYDGSLDESYDEGILLDSVEPLDEDQLCWPLGYIKSDLEYAIKNCSIIRRNRVLYKKYISKDESTSDESDFNYDFKDKCRTSDEEFLDDAAVFGNPQDIKIPEFRHGNKIDSVVPQNDQIVTTISNNYKYLLSQTVENDISYMLPSIESKEQATTKKDVDSLLYKDDIVVNDKSNILANDANSKSLRQLAKLKFCTEPPKPVSINPKEFIGQMNRKKMLIISIPSCAGSAEILSSIDGIFRKIEHYLTIKAVPLKAQENPILSATIMSTSEFSSIGSDDKSLAFEKPEPKATLATCDLDDFPRNPMSKKRHSLTNNLLYEICDIKDIDSLSINTEDSSMTQTELISENDILKNNVPLSKMKSYQKATLDSELDASLGISSFADGAFVIKSSSNDSINSLDNCSSSNKSASDVMASNEDDIKSESFNKVSQEYPNTDYGAMSKSLRFLASNDLNKSKNRRFKRMFALKPNRVTKKHQKDDEQNPAQSCPVIDEGSPMDVSRKIDQEMYESVTPPHDILLDDDPLKSFEMMSQCQFTASSVIINSLENPSKQRVCDIHKQLEDIEDRLRMLESKSIDIKEEVVSVSKQSSTIELCANSEMMAESFQYVDLGNSLAEVVIN